MFPFVGTAEEDEFEEPVGAVSLTTPAPPSTTPRRGSKGNKMTDNYDVENQGRPEPATTVTTCLMEKPDIDKKVKVSVTRSFFASPFKTQWLVLQ